MSESPKQETFLGKTDPRGPKGSGKWLSLMKMQPVVDVEWTNADLEASMLRPRCLVVDLCRKSMLR